jgi:hypothetical protein
MLLLLAYHRWPLSLSPCSDLIAASISVFQDVQDVQGVDVYRYYDTGPFNLLSPEKAA